MRRMRIKTIALCLLFGLSLTVTVLAESQEPPIITMTGWLHVIQGDKQTSTGFAPVEPNITLIDEEGNWSWLNVEQTILQEFGGLREVDGKRARIVGVPDAVRRQGMDYQGQVYINVVSLTLLDGYGAKGTVSTTALTGSKPWVILLCKVSKSDIKNPDPIAHYTALLGSQYPGLDHYWRELSYNNINLNGSKAAGWFNLPQPASYYWTFDGNNYWFDIQKVTTDCAAAADASIYFPDYAGIAFIVPAPASYEGAVYMGGSAQLSLDGQTKHYKAVWIPHEIGFYQNCPGPWLMGHEMGHSFGLPHSSGPYNKTYDSGWDVLSGTSWGFPCNPLDPVWGCIGQHTIAFHKDLLGWIPPKKKFVLTSGAQTIITLERLALPQSSNFLLLQLPIQDSQTKFYTVEARKFAGYDSRLPGEAVIIHKVDKTRSDRLAQVVDVDNNGNPNDEGAMWRVGETFTDATNGISLKVISATNSGFMILVNGPDKKVQFSAASSSGPEWSTPAVIKVTLSAASVKTVKVNYATANGTAKAGSDYTAISGTLTFSPGVTSKTINVPIIDDATAEGNETFTVSLTNPVNAALGTPKTHIYTILANDPIYGTLQFKSATYTVGEAGGSVRVCVTRTGGRTGAVGVSYATANGTANAGFDYTAKSGKLSWLAADAADKCVNVPIINDSKLYENNETFTVTLSKPTGGAALGRRAATKVTIIDNDLMPNVAFPAPATWMDFDGDGRSDLTELREGTLRIVLMSGEKELEERQNTLPSTHKILGYGDWDGDGRAEILLRDDSGSIKVWLMEGTKVREDRTIATLPAGAKPIGIGDVNGDGRADLLWRDRQGVIHAEVSEVSPESLNVADRADGKVDALSISRSPVTLGWMDSQAEVISLGDYDGDGRMDILLKDNDETLRTWLMEKTGVRTIQVPMIVPSQMMPIGTGDMNGDGTTDILWRDATNNLQVWLMNGINQPKLIQIGQPTPGWEVIGVGDYDGDGVTDILWTYRPTGERRITTIDNLTGMMN